MKIILPEEAEKWAAQMRADGLSVVQAHGCFDLLHPGHIRYLEKARGYGDKLVVTVTADRYVNKGPGRPAFTHDLRCEMLAALSCVDAVVVNDNATAIPLIAGIKPTVYVKGNEYENATDDMDAETREVERHGGKTVFDGETVFSSTALINGHLALGNRHNLAEFRRRNYEEKIPGLLETAKDLSVLFIGETILDEYVYVSPLGKPPKEFVIACLKNETEIFSGGIEAAAHHARQFFGKIDVITRRSVTKRRYIDRDFNRKLFEVYEMDDAPPSFDEENETLRLIEDLCPDFDITVVVDFGHGMMTRRIRDAIWEHSKFLAVNAQSNSANHGFNPVTKYRADYICVDAPEARLALGDQHADLETCAKHLAKYAEKVCITDGRRGSVAYADGACVSVPPVADKVVDTMGAGDAFLAVTAPLASLTSDVEMLAFVGNIVGAIKVGIVGHREPVGKKQVLRYVQSLLK